MIFFQWYNRFHALVAHLALLSKTTPSYDVITPRHTFFMINASHYLKKLSLSFQFKIKLERSCLKNCLRTCKRLAHQFLLKSTFCLTLPSEKHFHRCGGGSGLWTWPYQRLFSSAAELFICRGWGRLVVTETNSDKSSRECQGSPWGNRLRHLNQHVPAQERHQQLDDRKYNS